MTRSLLRNRMFALATVSTLAIGLGLTIAVYSVVDAVLVRPIPFADDERLVVLWETDRNSGTTREPASFPDFLDFQRRGTTLDRLGAFSAGEMNLIPDAGDPVRIASLSITANLLPLLGVSAERGALFTDADDRPGGRDSIVISDRLWSAMFERRPDAVGRTITLNGRARTIVGIAPAHADFGAAQILSAAAYSRGFAARDSSLRVDVWTPLQGDEQQLPRDTHPLLMIGRLASSATRAEAQGELASIARDLERDYPVNRARGVFVEPLRDVVLGPVRPVLVLLLAAVAVLLLIACVNATSLMLARATTRVREVAVRAALGAGLQRIARQFIVESAVLTTVAAVAAIFLAGFGLRFLVALAPRDIPRLDEVHLDAHVLAIALVLSSVVGIVFGSVPVLYARRVDLQSALRTNDARTATRHSGSRRAVLVIGEVALAVTLVTGAGLLLQTVLNLERVDPGFTATGVLKAEFQLPPTRYPVDFRRSAGAAAVLRFNDALISRVRALPGVVAAGLATNQPLDGGFTNSFAIIGREGEAANWPEISVRRVSPGYFQAVRLPLLGGRALLESDGPASPPVALINEATARRFFAARNPIGSEIDIYGTPRRVVGVVKDEKIHGVAEPAPIATYLPMAQVPDGREVLVVRTAGDARAIGSAVRDVFRALDPALTVFAIEPLQDTLANSMRTQRFLMQLVALFAAIALLLAAVGIHGLLAYMFAQRTREIGVRVALGATTAQVARLVVGQGARLTAAGVALGVALSFVLTESMRSLLFGVAPSDPWTLAAVVGLLAGIALLACYLPARQAMRIDPTIALRYE